MIDEEENAWREGEQHHLDIEASHRQVSDERVEFSIRTRRIDNQSIFEGEEVVQRGGESLAEAPQPN